MHRLLPTMRVFGRPYRAADNNHLPSIRSLGTRMCSASAALRAMVVPQAATPLASLRKNFRAAQREGRRRVASSVWLGSSSHHSRLTLAVPKTATRTTPRSAALRGVGVAWHGMAWGIFKGTSGQPSVGRQNVWISTAHDVDHRRSALGWSGRSVAEDARDCDSRMSGGGQEKA